MKSLASSSRSITYADTFKFFMTTTLPCAKPFFVFARSPLKIDQFKSCRDSFDKLNRHSEVKGGWGFGDRMSRALLQHFKQLSA